MPDLTKVFKLDFSGTEVNTAIQKVLEGDPTTFGIQVLESSAGSPYDINGLTTPGMYSVMYLKCGDSAGDETTQKVTNTHPSLILVSQDTSYAEGTKFVQTTFAVDGSVYSRYTTSNGDGWSSFEGIEGGTSDIHIPITSEEVNDMFADPSPAVGG